LLIKYFSEKNDNKKLFTFLHFLHFQFLYLSLDIFPQGKHKRGKSAMIWKKIINKEIEVNGKNWSEIKAIVPNRVKWRKLVDVLCSIRR